MGAMRARVLEHYRDRLRKQLKKGEQRGKQEQNKGELEFSDVFWKRFGLGAEAQMPAPPQTAADYERKLAEDARRHAETARAAVTASADLKRRKDEGEGQVASCPQMQRSRAFLDSLHLSAAYFEPEQDRCYCPSCAAAVQMPDVLEQGSPHGSPYEVPKGWCVMQGESGECHKSGKMLTYLN